MLGIFERRGEVWEKCEVLAGGFYELDRGGEFEHRGDATYIGEHLGRYCARNRLASAMLGKMALQAYDVLECPGLIYAFYKYIRSLQLFCFSCIMSNPTTIGAEHGDSIRSAVSGWVLPQ